MLKRLRLSSKISSITQLQSLTWRPSHLALISPPSSKPSYIKVRSKICTLDYDTFCPIGTYDMYKLEHISSLLKSLLSRSQVYLLPGHVTY